MFVGNQNPIRFNVAYDSYICQTLAGTDIVMNKGGRLSALSFRGLGLLTVAAWRGRAVCIVAARKQRGEGRGLRLQGYTSFGLVMPPQVSRSPQIVPPAEAWPPVASVIFRSQQ